MFVFFCIGIGFEGRVSRSCAGIIIIFFKHSSGDALLVHPVVRPGATEVKVYLPGPSTLWYDVDTHAIYPAVGYQTIPVTIEKVRLQLSI